MFSKGNMGASKVDFDRVTLGLNAKNADLFLDMIHPEMVWLWPPTSHDHDPVRCPLSSICVL
jgi:hypothetical protein